MPQLLGIIMSCYAAHAARKRSGTPSECLGFFDRLPEVSAALRPPATLWDATGVQARASHPEHPEVMQAVQSSGFGRIHDVACHHLQVVGLGQNILFSRLQAASIEKAWL